MSWDGHKRDGWHGEALRVKAAPELVALVDACARRPGGARSVPVHVRCSAGHDSGVRFIVEQEGAAVVVALHREGAGAVWWTYDDAAAEAVTRQHRERKDAGQPAGAEAAGMAPLQMECGACGRVGQIWTGKALGRRVLRALGEWASARRQRNPPRFPRFVWPGAGV